MTADLFLEQLHASHSQQLRFQAKTKDDWQSWRAELQQAVRQQLALPAYQTHRTEAVQLEYTHCGDYIREKFEMETLPQLNMPFYLLRPAEQKPHMQHPAIVANPGHGYGYKQLVGLLPDGTPRTEAAGIYKDYPIQLAKRGYIVIVPEPLGFGERRLQSDQQDAANANVNSCFRLASVLLMYGQTLAGIRVYELMRCIDYLTQRSDTLQGGIGSMSFSGGALISALTAALDERLYANVMCGYINTFQTSILSKPHCLDNYIPGLMNIADLPDICGLIAPRPLFIESGKQDSGFPIQGVYEAVERLTPIYRLLGHTELPALHIHHAEHEISGERAYDWLDRHLQLSAPKLERN